jgi:imidazolonepropionase-like amidohydrolase
MHTTPLASSSSPRPLRPLRSLFFALCALATPSLAQDLTIKAPPQAQTTVIRNAVIHTVTGETIANGSIIFDKGVITDILPGDPHIPMGWRVVDAKGNHVYPGLIAPYTQLGLTEIQAVAATNDLTEVGGVTPEVRAVDAVNPDSNLLTVTRSNGVLIAGVFPAGGTVAGQGGVVRLDGWTVKDMAISPSVGMVLRWPNVRPFTAWWMDRSEEDQLKEVRENLAAIETTFDTAKAYDDLRDSNEATPVDLRWEAMRALFPPPWGEGQGGVGEPTTTAQLPLFLHANDLDQINSAVQFCATRGLRMVLVGGRDAEQAAGLLKQHNVPVIIQGTHNLPRRDDAPFDDAFTLPARLAAAGLTVTIEISDDTAHERNLPYNTATAVAFGLPHGEGLRCLTINAAKVLGIDDRYGSLEKGKSATLIVTTGDPMEVSTLVTGAFIDGREIDLSNKQTTLARKYLERYRQTGDIKAK